MSYSLEPVVKLSSPFMYATRFVSRVPRKYKKRFTKHGGKFVKFKGKIWWQPPPIDPGTVYNIYFGVEQ